MDADHNSINKAKAKMPKINIIRRQYEGNTYLFNKVKIHI